MNGFTVRSVIVNGVNKGAIQINEPESPIVIPAFRFGRRGGSAARSTFGRTDDPTRVKIDSAHLHTLPTLFTNMYSQYLRITWLCGWEEGAPMGPGGTGWIPDAAPEGPTSGGRKWLVSRRLSSEELSYSSENGSVFVAN